MSVAIHRMPSTTEDGFPIVPRYFREPGVVLSAKLKWCVEISYWKHPTFACSYTVWSSKKSGACNLPHKLFYPLWNDYTYAMLTSTHSVWNYLSVAQTDVSSTIIPLSDK